MSGRESKKKKASEVEAVEALSWRQKKAIADLEEEAVGKEVEDLVSWTNMIEAMGDKQLKEYLSNRPESTKSAKTGKSAAGKKVRRMTKSRSSSSSTTSQGLMASVWKFHREDDTETSISFKV